MTANVVRLGDQWFDYADILVDVMIGYACNVQCDYCSITDEMRRENMATAPVMAALADARRRGATRVAFGGGEPTIRRSLLPLVRWCRDRGWRSIKIPSNGLMYSYRTFAEEACDAGITDFHISFMAHTDALYARIMGRSDALALVTEGVRNLQALGRKPVGDLIIKSDTWMHLADIVEHWAGLGIETFNLWLVSLSDRNRDNLESVTRRLLEVEVMEGEELRQILAPTDERVSQEVATRGGESWRQPVDRIIDHRVGEIFLERRGHGVPDGAGKLRQEASVERAAVPREPEQIVVVAAKADELRVRVHEPGERPHEPVELHERPVAVARNRLPSIRRRAADACPTPLIGMAVPVPDEHVEEPSGEKRACVHGLVRMLRNALEQLFRAHHLHHAGALGGRVFRIVSGTQLDQSEHARELLPELAEARVVRHDDQLRRHV